MCACGFGVLSLARERMAVENLTVIVFCLFLFSVSLSVSQASSPPSVSISLSLLLSPFPRRLSLSFIASLFRSVCIWRCSEESQVWVDLGFRVYVFFVDKWRERVFFYSFITFESIWVLGSASFFFFFFFFLDKRRERVSFIILLRFLFFYFLILCWHGNLWKLQKLRFYIYILINK